MAKIHELKIWPKFFEPVRDGDKTFEVRNNNDRDFYKRDILRLMEWDPETKEFTGREVFVDVSYLMYGGGFAVADGHVVMGIKNPRSAA